MTIWTILGSGVGVLALAAVGTLLLPRHVHVERQATLPGDAEQVIALAASNTGYQRFNPYLSADPALKIAPFGPEAGVGSGFAFDGKDGTGTPTLTGVSAEAVTYTIDMGPMGQPVQSIVTAEGADGTTVTWRVESDLGFTPMFRVFGLFMDGMMGPTFELGLGDIRRLRRAKRAGLEEGRRKASRVGYHIYREID